MALNKHFDSATVERRVSEKWIGNKAFRAGANAKDGQPSYTIMIPPPNVTGVLHMGHAFNNTLQDILIRWKRMQGYDTLWQPGTDHAGIATQMVVERQLAEQGKKRTDFSRDEFLEKIWNWKKKSGGTIISQLQRLGASCDWDREAFTMSGAPNAPKDEGGNFHDAVIKVFVDLYKKGLIYRGKRLVNWDPHFETAISDLEVENIEVAGHMWHFKYPLKGGEAYTYIEKDENGNITLQEERDYISIATTRPETMLGDGAVAVHPSDQRYKPLIGKFCEIPVGPKQYRRLIPIITDEYPDPNFGSGAVKITGAHDFNDYQVAKRSNIPMYSLMDKKGVMRVDGLPYKDEVAKAQAILNEEISWDEDLIASMNLVPDEYRGLDRFEARKKVVAEITAEGLAVMVDATDNEGNLFTKAFVESKPIMQPFGDRSKVVIEPMLTDQWFVETSKIVKPALDAVRNGEIKIIPESGEKTYYHWLNNIEPWCISRQLWWGHQVPVWFDKDGNQFCAVTESDAQEQAGSDVQLTRDPDVLDTWFSSGLWPIGTLGWPEDSSALNQYFPTSTLVTGQDILFFWVARMIMMQLAVRNEIPFDTVYLHGLVRDAKGKKMSKSTGNVVDPIDIIDEYGADALRFTNASMASIGGVLKLDTQRIAGYRNFGTKLWNAARFASLNEANFGLSLPAAKETVNRWIVGETIKTLNEVNIAFDQFRFNDAAQALYSFVWGTVCDWYVELSKPLLNSDVSKIKNETRQTMGWVIDHCLILLHPIMPFITEELWETLTKRNEMLVHCDWPEYDRSLIDHAADLEMNWVVNLIESIRSARAQLRVPAGLKIPMILLEMDSEAKQAWENNSEMIQKLARITELTSADEIPKGSVAISAKGASFALPLEGIIDVEEEKKRLSKSLDKLQKEISALKGRLQNSKFIESAPEEVILETQENLVLREEEKAKLSSAASKL
ncbi:MAG: valine--tRNA ligase [Rhodobacteraceae bacterium TMED111]|nr:valine--tRNA ligase [Marinovum sp.]OUV40203.1 MAG: valine--tRNA ligase [Rhodobacteraceae bacterium TMED111]